MVSAFKLFPEDETATGGEFGTSPFGTDPFGGVGQGYKYDLPPNEVPGDDPTASYHWLVAEAEQRRLGKLLGARKYDDWRVWTFRFSLLAAADVDALLLFFRARRFKFIPDSTEEESFVESHWLGREFAPRSRRGSYYELSFSIEER
jgi:hypothetical protein